MSQKELYFLFKPQGLPWAVWYENIWDTELWDWASQRPRNFLQDYQAHQGGDFFLFKKDKKGGGRGLEISIFLSSFCHL